MQAGPGGLAERALTLFGTHSPEALARLDRAVAAGEAGEIRRAAHALKSMSLNVGARRISSVCGEIERRAAAGSDVAGAFDALLAEARAAHEEAVREAPFVKARFARAAA